VAALLEALRCALAACRKPDGWREGMRRGVARDFSWDASAARCAELYRSLAD
jgi:starch synthase